MPGIKDKTMSVMIKPKVNIYVCMWKTGVIINYNAVEQLKFHFLKICLFIYDQKFPFVTSEI